MTKSSKTPFFLGGCGCLSVLLGLVLLGAWFATDKASQWMSSSMDGAGLVSHYTNSPEGLTGALAEYYVDFEFDYPMAWTLKPQDPGSSNYVSVERSLGDSTCENFNVGYFQTTGSMEGNRILYPVLISQLQAQFEQQFPGLNKVDEGETTIGSYEGWHALFSASVGDASEPSEVFMRTVLLPTPDGTRGVAIIMMGTDACSDISQPADLGVTGELPVIVNSFRFGE